VNLGAALHSLGRTAEAREAAARALELDPANPAALALSRAVARPARSGFFNAKGAAW
jgi:Flp pilus assembly protein TadD